MEISTKQINNYKKVICEKSKFLSIPNCNLILRIISMRIDDYSLIKSCGDGIRIDITNFPDELVIELYEQFKKFEKSTI
jgi:hypothetical protein